MTLVAATINSGTRRGVASVTRCELQAWLAYGAVHKQARRHRFMATLRQAQAP